ncbi:MAG TPA: FtsX-like permease family protein [Ktedonobacteraceae bacterium]
MFVSSPILTRQNGVFLLRAIARLASWRLKQMWRFLLVTWLSILAMVVLACAPPLFSRVAISASLRAAVASSPDGQSIIVHVVSLSPTTAQLQQQEQRLDGVLRQGDLATYLRSAPRLVVQTPPLSFSLANGSAALVLDGYDPVQAASHATLVQGRLPQATTDGTLEIALTPTLAGTLGLSVGSVVNGQADALQALQGWKLRVVGIVAARSAHDPYWLAPATPFGDLYTSRSGASAYNVLTAREPLRVKIATLQTLPGKDATNLFWSYPFDLTSLDASSVPALSQQMYDLYARVPLALNQIPGVSFSLPVGSLFATLSTYAQQIIVLELVIACLLFLILTLILFLIGMTVDLLVERQVALIATLRSRGATQQHIFGSFLTQGLLICLLALLAGPPLALLLVYAIAGLLLTPADQAALTVISARPLAALYDVRWFALAAVGLALLVLVAALRRAVQLDIVTLRRESTRGKGVPFWKRFHLDLFALILILAGYLVYSFFWQTIVAAQTDDPIVYNAGNIVGFVAPPLVVGALLMLFLRLFPRILSFAAALAAKKRSAPAVLAFVQAQRAPRAAARIIVLLALALSASCFLLTLMNTRQARTADAAAFAVGADFSGSLPAEDATKSFEQLRGQYNALPGVQAATLGYSADIDNALGDIRLFAVDTSTYASTALWPANNATQSLSTLTAQLAAHKNDALTRHIVYALVDATLWQRYELSPGERFTLYMNGAGTLRVNFIALAEINNIPGSYNTPLDAESDIGMIVDYQSYASVYASQSGQALQPNALWLRTSDDPAALAAIRAQLPDLQDRRALTALNQEDSTHIDVLGALGIGVGAALLLALIGVLLSSWLSAFNRQTSFAVLRALGMAPREIAALLLWEQGLVYGLAFVLGTGLAALLAVFIVPTVTLLDLSGSGSLGNPYDIPPIQIVVPYLQLGLLLGALALISLLALLLMARLASHPSLGQHLRINED